MNANSLKPFDDKKYVSEEEALKWVESLPKPEKKDSKKGDSHSDTGQETKQDISETESPQTEPITLEGRILDIDLVPYSEKNNPLSLGQDDWIKKFNGLKRVTVSMPDLYLAGKSNNKKLWESLRDDFTNSWEISSTRIIYNKNDLNGKVIHYFGSKFTKPLQSGVIYIPNYNGIVLDDVLSTKEGLFYLQTLFGTKDNANQIKQTLQRLSDYQSDNTKVWTPNQNNRKSVPNRASGLNYNIGVFLVYGNLNFIDYIGRSRGVRISAAGASQKNGGVK